MKDLYPSQTTIVNRGDLIQKIMDVTNIGEMNTLRTSVLSFKGDKSLLKMWQNKFWELKKLK